MKEFMKRVRISMMMDAVLIIILGICFIAAPETAMTVLFQAGGVLLLIGAIANVIERHSDSISHLYRW